MDRHRWAIHGVLGGLAWAWLGLGLAQAGTIPPTKADFTLDVGSSVTLSLYQKDSDLPSALTLNSSSPSRCTTAGTSFYRDVTDCWLPEVGKSVFVVVNGSTAVPTLVPPITGITFPLLPGATNPFVAALTTSAYRGVCGNTGSGNDSDFLPLPPTPTITLQTSATTLVTGYELIPQDCGGMAVIAVGSLRFIVPKDGTATAPANGIPEIWENLYGGNLNPSDDFDTGPAASSPTGDGISTFDEYRGFMVSGKQLRFNPLQKDLVVRLVTDQCPTTQTTLPSLPSGAYPKPTIPTATLTLPGTAGAVGAIGTFTASAAVFAAANVRGEIIGAGGRARISAFNSSTSVSAQITQAFSGTSIAAGSWQLSESLFANVYGLFSPERLRVLGGTNEWVDNLLTYTDLGGLQFTTDGPASDRVINANRVYGSAQKGIRVIECLDDGTTSPYGWALGGTGSPNSTGQIGNVIVYTKRAFNKINSLITSGAQRKVRYSPMLTPILKGTTVIDWDPKIEVGVYPYSDAVKDFVISKALQFYAGMEIGHVLNLNLAASSAPHFPSSSGDVMDAAITSKPDKNAGTTDFNTFYIPSNYGSADQLQLLLK
jgi:hypothetical protein